MVWYAWVMIAFLAFGALATIAIVGKVREPVTHDSAIFTVIAAALMIFGIVQLATP